MFVLGAVVWGSLLAAYSHSRTAKRFLKIVSLLLCRGEALNGDAEGIGAEF